MLSSVSGCCGRKKNHIWESRVCSLSAKKKNRFAHSSSRHWAVARAIKCWTNKFRWQNESEMRPYRLVWQDFRFLQWLQLLLLQLLSSSPIFVFFSVFSSLRFCRSRNMVWKRAYAWQPLTLLRYVYSPWAFELSGNKSRATYLLSNVIRSRRTHMQKSRRFEFGRRETVGEHAMMATVATVIWHRNQNSMLDWPMLL